MEFNKNLLSGNFDEGLEKLILFCLREDVSSQSFVSFLEDDTLKNKVLLALKENESIKLDYNKPNTRFSLTEPLYVTTQIKLDLKSLVRELRSLFEKTNTGEFGLMSTEPDVLSTLQEWLKKYSRGNYTKETILQATRKYIQHCKEGDVFIKRCNNFIMDGRESLLAAWIEESDNNSYKSHKHII